MAARSRALVVRQRGSPPSTVVATLAQRSPREGEVLVQVQACALTPTDLVLCVESRHSLVELLPNGAVPFVPGFFFCGEVRAVGRFVEGLRPGEPVIGVLDSGALAVGWSPQGGGAGDGDGRGGDSFGLAPASTAPEGGCYRDHACVHFSRVLPAEAVLSADLRLPMVLAHLPPMVDALFCATTHLRLREGEAALIVAPRLMDVIFLLQRLLLQSSTWCGPLFLLVLEGRTPTRAELERHALLRPVLLRAARGNLGAGAVDEGPRATFLDDFLGLSLEERLQHRGAAGGRNAALADLVGEVLEGTSGAGVDVLLALDVDLAPTVSKAADASGEDGAALAAAPPGEPSVFRLLLGALAVRGRFVTNCGNLELMPHDGEHLWLKEASVSFLNPHTLPLSGSRRGSALHAVIEVLGRLVRGDAPVVEPEVAQYRLFEQFHAALEAASARRTARDLGAGGGGQQLVLLTV